MLVCFDIDGTLADVSHRVKYWRETPKNWAMFKAEMINDEPITPIVKIAQDLWTHGHTVILCSGRGEESRKVTEEWMKKHAIEFHKLYMRVEKDYRGDDIVKKELLDQIIQDWGKAPDIVFDDRPRVVQMWRENGVFVADVYQGTEDF